MKISRYTRILADRMGLKDWEIEVIDEIPEGEAEADCRVTYGQQHAVIRLRPCFFEHTPSLQRHVVVHELTHIHLANLQETIKNVAEHLGQPAFQLFQLCFKDSLEIACDNVARAISSALPLPEKLSP